MSIGMKENVTEKLMDVENIEEDKVFLLIFMSY